MASLEAEVALARKPNIYLTLDLAQKSLAIKARGIVLDEVPVLAVEAAARQAFYFRPRPVLLPVPVVLEVLQGPGDTDREVIAPTRLRPASRQEDEEETPLPAASQTPTPTPTPKPETPTRYRVEVFRAGTKHQGKAELVLWVSDSLPARNVWQRFREAVKEGWAYLRGRGEITHEPPGIVLVVKGEDARRLHHLFRQGMTMLVTSTAL
ncbi:MAG: hypothetical protein NZ869_07230 [Thermoanaerobaculum sp.]|nr:hypothetical protein [Thermoanaerobaculum sp.]MDW7967780.1 hypothetical protein [Thermoanaerobaculum sp.]